MIESPFVGHGQHPSTDHRVHYQTPYVSSQLTKVVSKVGDIVKNHHYIGKDAQSYSKKMGLSTPTSLTIHSSTIPSDHKHFLQEPLITQPDSRDKQLTSPESKYPYFIVHPL